MSCGKILGDILKDCNDVLKGGIEQGIVLINRSDIDYANSVVDSDITAGTHKITTLQLKTGTTGYLIEGIGGKQIFTAGYTANVADDQPDDFTHSVSLRLFNCSEASASFMNNLAAGADLAAVVRHKNGCYSVYGWDAGLKISEATLNSNENKGAAVFTLSSSSTDTEPKVPYIYFDTDDATSESNFVLKFAA